MTKAELKMMEEMIATMKDMSNRIAKLESRNKSVKTTSTTTTTKSNTTVTTKSSDAVGNLLFDGKYVKTGDLKSSKARYAIRMRIEELGGKKLGKGNPIYDEAHKHDKYVQVYEFKTVADCKKFRKEQEARVGK